MPASSNLAEGTVTQDNIRSSSVNAHPPQESGPIGTARAYIAGAMQEWNLAAAAGMWSPLQHAHPRSSSGQLSTLACPNGSRAARGVLRCGPRARRDVRRDGEPGHRRGRARGHRPVGARNWQAVRVRRRRHREAVVDARRSHARDHLGQRSRRHAERPALSRAQGGSAWHRRGAQGLCAAIGVSCALDGGLRDSSLLLADATHRDRAPSASCSTCGMPIPARILDLIPLPLLRGRTAGEGTCRPQTS